MFDLISKFGEPYETVINDSLSEIYMSVISTLPDHFKVLRPVEVNNVRLQLAMYCDESKPRGLILNELSGNWQKMSYCKTADELIDLINGTIKKEVWFDATVGFYDNTDKMVFGISACAGGNVVKLGAGDFKASLRGERHFEVVDSNNVFEHIEDSEYDEDIKNVLTDLATFLTSD